MTKPDVLAWLRQPRIEFVAGLRITVDQPVALHQHAGLEIVFHVRGRGTTRLADGRELAFARGDVVVYPPGQLHDQRMIERGEDFCVHLRCDRPLPPPLADCWHVAALDDAFALGEIAQLSRVPREDAPLEKLALDLRGAALLARLIALARRVAASPSQHLADRAHRFIRERHDAIGSVDEVAEALGVSADHLRHAFKKQHGISVVRCLAETRIEKAKDLLQHSSLPLRDIAKACAFGNERYFSAVFRKLTGTTPGAYRGRSGHVRPNR